MENNSRSRHNKGKQAYAPPQYMVGSFPAKKYHSEKPHELCMI